MALDAKIADILSARPNYSEWLAEPPIIGDWARKFYRDYVGIADEEELKRHLMEVREAAWKIYKYRCVASFFFVNYNLGEEYGWDWYKGLVERVKGGDTLLDLGCAFGHTARNLVYDGAPQENIISGDLRAAFCKVGYQLFRDKEKFHGRFYQGDIFDPNYLEEFNGKFNIIHASAFFHLFGLQHQTKIVERLLQIATIKSGTIIFGRQVGCTIPRYLQHPLRLGEGLYMHSEESFRQMWESVVAPGEWDIKLQLVPRTGVVADNGGAKGRLHFIITKL